MKNVISDLRRQLKIAHQNRLREEEEHSIFIPPLYTYPQAFLYFIDMAKDAVDTFYHYKSPEHRQRDVWQWYYGLGNVLAGCFFGFIALCFFVSKLFFDVIPSLYYGEPGEFLTKSYVCVYDLGSDFLGMSAQFIRGITQLVTSPFSLLKVPLRTYLTRNSEWETFQDRKSVVRLVNQADSIIENNGPGSVGSIRKVIDALANKAHSNGHKKQEEKGTSQHNFQPPTATKVSSKDFIKKHKPDEAKLTPDEIEHINNYVTYFRK